MKRGVETVSILGVGILLTIGLMLYADWRTNQNVSEEQGSLPPSEQPLTEEAFQASLETREKKKPKVSQAKSAVSKKSDKGNGMMPDDPVLELAPIVETGEGNDSVDETPSEPVTAEVPSDDKRRMENEQEPANKPLVEPVTEALDDGESKDEETEAESEVEVVLVATPKPAQPSPDQELVLLEKAHDSLSQLHQLLLRTDQSRARSKQEADKLGKILDQLPKETQEMVRGWIKAGYERRIRRATPTASIADRSAKSVSISEASLGQRDDTPADLKALQKRIHLLRTQVSPQTRPNTDTNSGGVRGQAIGPGIQATSF